MLVLKRIWNIKKQSKFILMSKKKKNRLHNDGNFVGVEVSQQ